MKNSQLKSFIEKITEFGVYAANTKSEKRNVVLTNYISLVAAASPLVLLVSQLFFSQLNFDSNTFLVFICIFIFLLPILFNGLGFIHISRFVLCWSPSFFIMLTAIIGLKESTLFYTGSYIGIRFFLLAFSCFPFLVYDLRNIRPLSLVLSFPLFILFCFDLILNFFGVGYESVGLHEVGYQFTTVRVAISFLIIGAGTYSLKRYNERTEDLNEKLIAELAEKNDQILKHTQQTVNQLSEQLDSNLKQLSERELWFRTLFNSAHDAIFMMEKEKFIDCNEATLKIFQCTRDQIVGQTPLKFSPEFQADGSTSQNSALMRINVALSGTPQTFEWTHLHYDGTPFDAEVSLNCVRLNNDVFLQAIVRDITARKQAEDIILKKNEELIKTNTELDRFVYSASHDLRAPIASLLGLIQVARMEKSMDGIANLLSMQERSLLKLDHFINDIVDYSRNNRQQIEPSLIDFDLIVKNTFEQLHFIDQVERLRKVITIDQQGEFYSDPKRLQIIFNNVISNAIKYADMRKADPYLEVNIHCNSDSVRIRVGDNGEGIKPVDQEKIFDMFYRASQRSSGSGLGLYIVEEAVQKLQGQIKVRSDFGEGTEFEITIPGLPSPKKQSSNNYSTLAK